jgi:hypothetical protein
LEISVLPSRSVAILDLACEHMRNARIGAIIYPGYVLQHLLSDDGKGGSLFVFEGMVERVAIVAGDGYYEVRREKRQVKISPTYILHPPTLASRTKLRKRGYLAHHKAGLIEEDFQLPCLVEDPAVAYYGTELRSRYIGNDGRWQRRA